jgi:hypothetical protein
MNLQALIQAEFHHFLSHALRRVNGVKTFLAPGSRARFRVVHSLGGGGQGFSSLP